MNKVVSTLFKINTASRDQLQNPGYVTGLIAELGLAYDPRNIYGPYTEFMNTPDEMGAFQNPVEFGLALVSLSKHQLRHGCEIGTYHGVTAALLATYLRRFNPDFYLLTFDIWRSPFTTALAPYLPCVAFINATSDALVGRSFDFCFIDADHRYDGVKRDYDNVGASSCVTMFHDIDDCYVKELPDGGVPRFWSDVKRKRSGTEIKDPSHPNHFGIGLLY